MQQALKKPSYGNLTMLDPDGLELCKCDQKRANWYLSRNLAEMISSEAFKLNFKPKGLGNVGDKYSLATKENRCVVCGTYEDLTKHHVIPHMYRKSYPTEIKSRSSHDIVTICVPCHVKYETEAMNLKKEIAKTIVVEPADHAEDLEHSKMLKTAKLCRSYLQHHETIPEEKRKTMFSTITQALGKISLHEMRSFVDSFEFKIKRGPDLIMIAVDRYIRSLSRDEIKDFNRRWRQHFLDVMSPRYMPKFWDVNRDF